MKTITTAKSLESAINARQQGGELGFVPTMGALHQGHLALIKNAEAHCDIVIISIFVNPTQFDNPADLEKYPRKLENDLQTIQETCPEALVFTPSVEEVYGQQTPRAEHFDFGPLSETMEGRYRSGHFDGVGSILKRLFALVQPDRAFFGEKDFQQLQIAKKLVELTGQNVTVQGVPIVREENGLALSSRNARLSEAKREEAGFIFDALKRVREKFGDTALAKLYEEVRQIIDEHAGFELEYFAVAEVDTLQVVEEKDPEQKYRGFIAVYVENVRLIDNLALN